MEEKNKLTDQMENEKRYHERNVYISNMPVEEALDLYKSVLNLTVETEMIGIEAALFRKTSEAVFAKVSSPHYPAAAMDGIVLKAKDSYGACEKTPKVLVEGEHFEYINTGGLIPENKDAVIMIEEITQTAEGVIQIIAPAYPWQHIRPVGEDIVKGEMILPSGHVIRPMDMGALLNGGVEEVKVFKKTRVGILPTGTEVIQSIDELKPGKIIDSNSKVFEGLIIEGGGIPKRYAPIRDEREVLKVAIQKAVEENDMLIINAGSSAGSKDFTADLIKELGKVVIHGIALKPGKPTILGMIEGKPVIGIPGYPVSAYFAFETFAKPVLTWHSGEKKDKVAIKAILSQRVVSSLKHQELVRVTLGEVGSRLIATPLNRGAGATMSLVRADGVLSIPRMSEGIESSQEVDITLIKPLDKILERLVLIGSHDLILDVIADKMPLSSGHTGSMGGIMSMRRGECHIAPIHLLDETSGEYNKAYIKKYFSSGTMALIKGVRRLQGLMVQKGNPKKINGFSDLIREDIHYVNRQRGAGTRQLLDYKLQELQLDFKSITGYNQEMTTHMSVAVTIASGGADTGLGVFSAAQAMDLDFIPACYEEYDFLVPVSYLEDPRIKRFIDILKSEDFKEKLHIIGGYTLQNPGEVLKVGD